MEEVKLSFEKLNKKVNFSKEGVFMKKLGLLFVAFMVLAVLVGCPDGAKSPFAGMTFKDEYDGIYEFTANQITVKSSGEVVSVYSYKVNTKTKEITMKTEKILWFDGKLSTTAEIIKIYEDMLKQKEEATNLNDPAAVAELDEAKKDMADIKEIATKGATATYTFDGTTLTLKDKDGNEESVLTKV